MNKLHKHPQFQYQSSLIWLTALIISLIFSIINHSGKTPDLPSEALIKQTGKLIDSRLKFINQEKATIARYCNGKTIEFFNNDSLQEQSVRLSNNSISLFIYHQNKMVFWNDNHDNISDQLTQFPVKDNFVYVGNTWYVVDTDSITDYFILYLIPIKSEYAYENDFLTNEFQPTYPDELNDFNPVDYEIPGSSVYSYRGEYLFSLVPVLDKQPKATNNFAILLAYLFALLLLFSVATAYTRYCGKFIPAFLFLLLSLLLLRIFSMWLTFPNTLYASPLFTPYPFAWSAIFPSLGDFFLSVFSLFLISLFVFQNFESNRQSSQLSLRWLVHLEALISGGFFVMAIYLIQGLIEHSSFIVDLNKVNEVEINSVGVYVIAGLLFGNFILMNLYASKRASERISQKLLSPVWLSLLVLPVLFTILGTVHWTMLLWVILLCLLNLIYHSRKREYSYSFKMSMILMMVIGAVSLIYPLGLEKLERIKKVYSMNLSTERDYQAELSLLNMAHKLMADSSLLSPEKSDEELYQYIKNQYLNTYLSTYYFQLYICSESDSIESETEGISNTCYGFFDTLIHQAGIPVADSTFYFIDDKDGTITYLGKILIPGGTENYRAYFLFDEKWEVNELGYPELLIEHFEKDISDRYHLSYAKYHKDNLVKQSGSYPYPLKAKKRQREIDSWHSFERNGYNHLAYRPDNQNTILVSSKSGTWYDVIILFSYLFFLFHLIFSAGSIVLNSGKHNQTFRFNFKNRIQISMIAIVVSIILIIGAGTIYFNIKQFNQKHLDMLSDKLRSVQIELEHKLAQEEVLDTSMNAYLSQLLIKFSNVFYTDINLYSPEGNLIASSREELFDKKLLGTKMNPEAFRQMQSQKSSYFIQNEQIGELSYLSAYVPFRNHANQVLIYLNLPYFTRESLIRDEIAGLITTAVNIYLLLIIITVVITVLLSNRLTRPLLLIQDKLGKLQLLGQNEKIEYTQKDEIGDLIEKYNQMVEELAQAAQLLARSERETAWREMARQIAHEIKNPLTPMRLHIQHLQRMTSQNTEAYEERVRKVSEILLTQIESLSAIASEFSNFATLSEASMKPVSLKMQLLQVYALFDKEDEPTQLELHIEGNGDYMIESNEEQIRRMLINLIKNAIQSIPEDRKGLVTINLSEVQGKYLLEVKDNGKGISEEVSGRLFEPYFTTKSSGTGLGLAIVKGIAESSNGLIRYETVLDKGSSFFVEFPPVKNS